MFLVRPQQRPLQKFDVEAPTYGFTYMNEIWRGMCIICRPTIPSRSQPFCVDCDRRAGPAHLCLQLELLLNWNFTWLLGNNSKVLKSYHVLYTRGKIIVQPFLLFDSLHISQG